MSKTPTLSEIDAAGLILFTIEGFWKRSITGFDTPLSAITVRHELPFGDSEPDAVVELEVRRSPAVGIDLGNTALMKLVAAVARDADEVAVLIREAESLRWETVTLSVEGEKREFRRAGMRGFWCAVAVQPVAGTTLTLVASDSCTAEALTLARATEI